MSCHVGLKYTNKSGTMISLSWDKDLNLDAKQFAEYQLKITKKLSVVESPLFKSSSTTSYDVKGLETATLYDIQVRIHTVDFGYSEYTEAITVKTDALSDSSKNEVEKLEDTVVSTFLKITLVLCLGLLISSNMGF